MRVFVVVCLTLACTGTTPPDPTDRPPPRTITEGGESHVNDAGGEAVHLGCEIQQLSSTDGSPWSTARFVVDDAGRLREWAIFGPSADSKSTYSWSGDGRFLQEINDGEPVLTLHWSGHHADIEQPGAAPMQSAEFDEKGQLVDLQAGDTHDKWSWDAEGRVILHGSPMAETRFTYSDSGALTDWEARSLDGTSTCKRHVAWTWSESSAKIEIKAPDDTPLFVDDISFDSEGRIANHRRSTATGFTSTAVYLWDAKGVAVWQKSGAGSRYSAGCNVPTRATLASAYSTAISRATLKDPRPATPDGLVTVSPVPVVDCIGW